MLHKWTTICFKSANYITSIINIEIFFLWIINATDKLYPRMPTHPYQPRAFDSTRV